MTEMPSASRAPHSPLLKKAEGRTLTTPDGVRLYYERLGRRGPYAPTIVLANGLGARLYAWEPLIERLYETHTILTWDYRGLFASSTPASRKSMSILRHAEDAVRILDAEGIAQASFAGWSMGVQVALEVAAEMPGRVDRLVLINGTHGHALETGFQPLFRMPWLPRAVYRAIEMGLENPALIDIVRRAVQSEINIRGVGGLMGRLRSNPRMEDVYRRYVYDVFGPSFPNFLRLFLELNAHSVYHLLPEIEHPALVISGGLDVLTPSYQSFEIARRLPSAEHYHLRWGSHFVILEYTDLVVGRVARFLGL